MIAVDTNVLVRLVLDDEPAQAAAVERILRTAGEGGIFISLLVVAEVAWVLKRGYRESPETILEIIQDVLATREFTVERPDIVEAALLDAHAAKCGLADALIGRINEDHGSVGTLTFDMRAKRLPTMRDAASFR